MLRETKMEREFWHRQRRKEIREQELREADAWIEAARCSCGGTYHWVSYPAWAECNDCGQEPQ